MTAVTRGLGPGSLNDCCSNEEGVVMAIGEGLKCWRCIVAKPPA